MKSRQSKSARDMSWRNCASNSVLRAEQICGILQPKVKTMSKEIDDYNAEIEAYNCAVDNENSFSDDMLTEMQMIHTELQRIGNILMQLVEKQKR